MPQQIYFPYNPLEEYQRPRFDVTGGDYGDSGGGLVSNMPMQTERFMRLSPELFARNPDIAANWSNSDNWQFKGFTPEGQPQFGIKSGDKEGTLYTLFQDPNGGFYADPQSTFRMDTNDQLSKWGPFLPALAMGGASLISGLSGTGFGGQGIGAAGGATGGAGGAAGGGLVDTQALANAGINIGDGTSAVSGFGGSGASGVTSFGQPFTTGATLSAGGEAGGALAKGANLVGVPGAIAGGALAAGSALSDLGGLQIPGFNAAPTSSIPSVNQPAVGPSPGGTNQQTPANKNKDLLDKLLSGQGSLTDWAKILGPLVGGGLLAYDAARQNGQQNPTDAYTRDWARNQLANAPTAPASGVTEQYRNAMMSGLSSGQNPALSGLLNKRFY